MRVYSNGKWRSLSLPLMQRHTEKGLSHSEPQLSGTITSFEVSDTPYLVPAKSCLNARMSLSLPLMQRHTEKGLSHSKPQLSGTTSFKVSDAPYLVVSQVLPECAYVQTVNGGRCLLLFVYFEFTHLDKNDCGNRIWLNVN